MAGRRRGEDEGGGAEAGALETVGGAQTAGSQGLSVALLISVACGSWDWATGSSRGEVEASTVCAFQRLPLQLLQNRHLVSRPWRFHLWFSTVGGRAVTSAL